MGWAGDMAPARNEMVGPDGGLRAGYAVLGPVLDRMDAGRLSAAGAALAAEGEARGVVVAGWSDGRQAVRPVPVDPLPRVVEPAAWAELRSHGRELRSGQDQNAPTT